MKTTKLFPKTHLWLVIPFIIIITSFYPSYWTKFFSVPFRFHVHGLTATCWYILVIIQPYLYQRNNLRLHRRLGLAGLFLAGGVIFSALQLLPFILSNPNIPPNIVNGIIYLDIVALGGFVISVYLGIRNVKNTRVHGRWMIATVFWSLLPALVRFLNFPVGEIIDLNMSFTGLVYVTNTLVFLAAGVIMLDDYRKEKVVYKSFSFIAIVMVIVTLTYSYVAESSFWGNLLREMIKI
ncbi:hypothetical protein [Lentiprolixibacter aurantiacus]|uniref:Uncharacterized protein n=1 Tax=Lentiprolixibacter aurantiacus TaxID=2993939 RepID=A0AAE3MI03_9FLAO|nr:hypothetical protein [Lentiprolixibacter aurantiacus]MCX2718010.1 hypothetical protein [Lentiprolixibacter aurantiacus]